MLPLEGIVMKTNNQLIFGKNCLTIMILKSSRSLQYSVAYRAGNSCFAVWCLTLVLKISLVKEVSQHSDTTQAMKETYEVNIHKCETVVVVWLQLLISTQWDQHSVFNLHLIFNKIEILLLFVSIIELEKVLTVDTYRKSIGLTIFFLLLVFYIN